LLIYQSPDSAIKIDVRLEDETVWLTLNQMAELCKVLLWYLHFPHPPFPRLTDFCRKNLQF
jgi:hypothetical protein